MNDVEYILGHSQKELARLKTQSVMASSITERLLREVRLTPGMRIFEIGSGYGDLSIQLAEKVGSSGEVVSIDQSSQAVAAARERVKSKHIRNVSFQHTNASIFTATHKFDIAIARFVLMHQVDPSEILRAAAQSVKVGGTVAICEADNSRKAFRSTPPVSLFEEVMDSITKLFEKTLPNYDVGSRLLEQFHLAGLPQPKLISEMAAVGGDDPIRFKWLSDGLEMLRPQLIAEGIITEDQYEVDGFEERLRALVSKSHSQVVFQPFYGAWLTIE